MFHKSIKKLQEQKKDIFYFEIILLFVFGIIVTLSFLLTEVKIWGDKTEAMFDIWFLQHTLSGMVASFLLLNLRSTQKYSLLIVIVFAYSWEFLEFFLETDSYVVVMTWMAGLEHPINRYAVDPLAAILGYVIINRFPRWVTFALIVNICFAIVHLWFGDSMAIQQFLY